MPERGSTTLRKDHSITAVNPTENTMSCPSRLEVMSLRWSRWASAYIAKHQTRSSENPK